VLIWIKHNDGQTPSESGVRVYFKKLGECMSNRRVRPNRTLPALAAAAVAPRIGSRF
jgi:hypothetical protein